MALFLFDIHRQVYDVLISLSRLLKPAYACRINEARVPSYLHTEEVSIDKMAGTPSESKLAQQELFAPAVRDCDAINTLLTS